jgi:hypothetical protein
VVSCKLWEISGELRRFKTGLFVINGEVLWFPANCGRFKTGLFIINGEVLWFPANCGRLPENYGGLKQGCL